MSTEPDLALRIAEASRPVVFCGAGLSAESGIPTFRARSDHALWSRFDPEELASLEGFTRAPRRVLDWYAWRRGLVAAAGPNPAHRALDAWAGSLLVTQNVDDLQERAGTDPDRIVHLHGSIVHDRCHEGCGWMGRSASDAPAGVLACPDCGGVIRPAVVWFGESLPEEHWQRAFRACSEADLLLVVGTSGVVQPASTLVKLASRSGAYVVNVNPEPTPLDAIADASIHAPAATVLPDLLPD
jgi:NAD-dependent deacetylase